MAHSEGGKERWRSPAKIARAKELRHPPTPAEERLWQAVRANRLGVHFRRQHVVHGFIADFYCHAARLVIELDGPVHDSQPECDDARTAVLDGAGLRVLRFRNEDVFARLVWVLQEIAGACGPSH